MEIKGAESDILLIKEFKVRVLSQQTREPSLVPKIKENQPLVFPLSREFFSQ